MAFSTVSITHGFQNPDGSAASGTVEFTLEKRMTNGTTTVLPWSITATLSATGTISQALVANNDSGTVPADATYRVDIRILGASQETYWITVPTNGGSVDLGTLLPQQPLGG